ncbi:hypothetical protein Ae331Ps2_6154 [Pseudonocardia sp. Ae331_Ps2]|nr:hypothetical protein Ae331Ps2_6154 [Pseudonocardia sp. Ae331_Ps2]
MIRHPHTASPASAGPLPPAAKPSTRVTAAASAETPPTGPINAHLGRYDHRQARRRARLGASSPAPLPPSIDPDPNITTIVHYPLLYIRPLVRVKHT